MHEAPPNAELVQRLAHAFASTGHQVAVTVFEDDSVRLVIRTAGRLVASIGLGVPW